MVLVRLPEKLAQAATMAQTSVQTLCAKAKSHAMIQIGATGIH